MDLTRMLCTYHKYITLFAEHPRGCRRIHSSSQKENVNALRE
jgi:hypothetical protein